MPLPFAHEPMPTVDEVSADLERIAAAIVSAGRQPDEPWAPGKWTRRQLACHIADIEAAMLDRLRRVIAEDEPELANIPEDLWVGATFLRDPQVAAQLFRACRSAVVELLRHVPASAWERRGRHGSFGWMRFADIVRHLRGHARHHARQLAGEAVPAVPAYNAESPTPRVHHHRAQIDWTNPDPASGGRYSRVHAWRVDGGLTLRASASPEIVPLPLSAADAIDPEEALVAAAASCHLLTFVWLAHRAGFTAASYRDDAEGELVGDSDGGQSIHRVVLRPRITWHGPQPDAATIDDLHRRAHHDCFIARSLRCAVVVASQHAAEQSP